MLECWHEDPHDRPTFNELRSKFGALLLAGKDDLYIDLEVDERKDYYTVKEEEEEESHDRRSSTSSEDSIDSLKKFKKKESIKKQPSNPYVESPAARRPASPQEDHPYADMRAPSRPIPRPGGQSASAEERPTQLGISLAMLNPDQSQQQQQRAPSPTAHEGLERRTTNPYVEDPSTAPTPTAPRMNLVSTTEEETALLAAGEPTPSPPNNVGNGRVLTAGETLSSSQNDRSAVFGEETAL